MSFRTEADVIRDGLDTFLAVIAERDRLRAENALLQQEIELKRDRMAAAERELAAEREICARLKRAAGELIEWLGKGAAILHDVAPDAVTVEPLAAEQTMRTAIRNDIRDNLKGASAEDVKKFVETWGSQ